MVRYCLPIAVAITFAVCVESSEAQRIPNYSRRATVSPYINLFNNNQGGVNNYFSFVRPMQQQARINQQQFSRDQFLQQQITQPTMMQPSMATGGMNGGNGMLRAGSQGIGQPSTAASYFNYSHFYTMPRTMRRR